MTEVTWVDCTAWLKARSDLPCEKIQAKAACLPTTGTFNLLSKILTTLRLSGAVWIEAGIASGCPRTCAPVIDSLRFRVCVSSPFAPLPVYYFFATLSTLIFSLSIRAAHHHGSRLQLEELLLKANRRIGSLGNRCCALISKSDQHSPEPILAREDSSSGLAMACSLEDSLQGLRGSCLA